MRKVVVLPYDVYSKKSETSTSVLNDPEKHRIKEIADEMRKVLNDSITPPGKKRIVYQKLLQTLLNKLNQLRPSSVGDKHSQSTVNDKRPEEDGGGNVSTVEEVTEIDHNYNTLKSIVRLGSKSPGLAIYEALKNTEGVEWKRSGEIVIDGSSIPQSNILDIVIDLSRKWKRKPPSGWNVLSSKLITSNFPKTYSKRSKTR